MVLENVPAKIVLTGTGAVIAFIVAAILHFALSLPDPTMTYIFGAFGAILGGFAIADYLLGGTLLD